MKKRNPASGRQHISRGGFSLVEVALALMVVSIGLVSLVGLIPASLDQNKKAIDDSQLGLYGQNVLNSYRSMLLVEGWSMRASMLLPGTGPDVWDPLKDITVDVGSAGTNVYQYISPQLSGENLEIEDFTTRYMFDVLEHTEDPNIMSCKLSLWPGQFGGTDDVVVFYTEVYNTDMSWK